MKLTKEDYMRLPKERLAELLVEQDKSITDTPSPLPTMPVQPASFSCDGTHCTNPHFDCVNCPVKTTGGLNTFPNTATCVTSPNTATTIIATQASNNE